MFSLRDLPGFDVQFLSCKNLSGIRKIIITQARYFRAKKHFCSENIIKMEADLLIDFRFDYVLGMRILVVLFLSGSF